ncbi:hypothetical protein [Lachnospira multipara]|uniref:DUF5050 domain-containing protein n=1 Tax=Lachnospira multipara TaxID=28051 RepID=A0A1H5UC77_9FIRM|nr:hypothetical protein [Lachnospira multipara]SEF72725.1 hypothetical protein SAMN05216537_1079 [Lachnospira multipara]
MKDFKKKLFVGTLSLVMLFNLAACSVNKKQNDAINYDSNNISEKNGVFMIGSNIAESENGYYFMAKSANWSKRFIAYYDKSSNESSVLCSKINCNHSLEDVDTECDAYVDGEIVSESLYYNEGYLYFIKRNKSNYMCTLCRVSADGSEHEIICDLKETPDARNSYFSYVVIGNYIFCAISSPDTENETTSIIEKINIESKTRDTIYSYTSIRADIVELSYHDNKLYFRQSESAGLLLSDLYSFDINTEVCKKISDDICSYIFFDDKLIYWKSYDGIYEETSKGDVNKIYEVEEDTVKGSLVYNGSNIYVLNFYSATEEGPFIGLLKNGEIEDRFYCFENGTYVPMYLTNDRIFAISYSQEGQYYAIFLLDEEGKIKDIVRTDIIG